MKQNMRFERWNHSILTMSSNLSRLCRKMADIRSRISRLGIQVAADESIRRWSDLESVIAAEACDLVVLKVQPLGGLEATRALINTAEAAGLGVVLSSALDTSVGLYQAAQLQAHLEHTRDQWHDAGLGTGSSWQRHCDNNP